MLWLTGRATGQTCCACGDGTVYEPDAAKDTEIARFTQATPWGEIKLGIDNPAALSQFEAGKTYYVDFTPVSEPQPA